MKYGNIDGFLSPLMQVVYDSGTLSSAVSSINITGLDGDVDETYELFIYRVVGGAGNSVLQLRFNSDTGANYGNQMMYGTSSTAAATRSTGISHAGIYESPSSPGEISLTRIIIDAKSGKERVALYFKADGINSTTIEDVIHAGCAWNNTSSNITAINIVGTASDAIGAGSRIILLKKCSGGMRYGNMDIQGKVEGAWELVQETTLSSAASSVTFSGLDGDNDVLYKLITRVVDNNNGGHIYLRPNNDSGSNYGRQWLYGGSTSVVAGRAVEAGMGIGFSNVDGDLSFSETFLLAKKGYVRASISKVGYSISGTTVGYLRIVGHSWNNIVDNITSLVLTRDASGFKADSNIQLYKLNL